MPEWATFVGFTAVVTAGLLVLSHASRGVFTEPDGDATAGRDAPHDPDDPDGDPTPTRRESESVVDPAGSGGADPGAVDAGWEPDGEPLTPDRRNRRDRDASVDAAAKGPTAAADPEAGEFLRPTSGVASGRSEPEPGAAGSPPDLSTPSLLANVAVSQGAFGALLVFGAWYAEIPAWAFGLGSAAGGVPAVAVGIGLGLALYAANEAGAAAGSRFGLGVGDGQRLRGALAPETATGWVLLLLVVLPVIAGFEELLFRGALVGVVAAGYGVPAWAMAVVASGAFALGHGAQGRLGVVVTGALGFVLAAAFVVTGSLVVVVVAHYVVNALEFVVHEGLGVEWPPDSA